MVVTSLPAFPKEHKPKNIILLIGDGMGLGALSAACYTNHNQLNIFKCPVVGFQKTHSGDDLITDSAAAATAIACGEKTYNTAIGVLRDSTPCRTIVEYAEAGGLATGLVATSSITHATPAAFAAHEPLRALDEPIALDLTNSGLDLMIGGGRMFFDQRTMDARNLIQELQGRNYYIGDLSSGTISQLKITEPRNIAFFTAENQPTAFTDGRNYLKSATRFAPAFLANRNTKGFFLMIEGSQIDWAGHANKYPMLISETLDFDEAVGEALAFAANNQETLVIITADHETGGLAINPTSTMKNINHAFTTKNHTGTMVPVFAFGPGASWFSGIYDNTDLYVKMKALLNL